MAHRVRVKICGITRGEDLDAAVAAGADAVGFNFHPPSPRSLTLAAANGLLLRVPPFVEAVGVFVEQRMADLADTLWLLGRLTTVQMHGGGHAEILPDVRYRYVPAFQVRDAADLGRVTAYLDVCRQGCGLPSAILIDGHAPGLTGGTGQRAPWDLLADFHPGVPLILAGGLTPDNVAEAIRRVQPYAVDVASGVEASPGVKDADKVRRFLDAVRSG